MLGGAGNGICKGGMFIGYSGLLEVRAQAGSISKEEGCGMEELYVQRPCG